VTERIRNLPNGTAADRVEEPNPRGAEAIVTACPWCVRTLSTAAGSSMKVYDIVELVERAIQ